MHLVSFVSFILRFCSLFRLSCFYYCNARFPQVIKQFSQAEMNVVQVTHIYHAEKVICYIEKMLCFSIIQQPQQRFQNLARKYNFDMARIEEWRARNDVNGKKNCER